MSFSSSASNRRRPAKKPDLPPGFYCIRDILEEAGPGEGQMTNLVGMVKDVRLPAPTNGTDFKCTITLFDLSTEESGDAIIFNLFRSEKEMPEVTNRDIILLFMVKIQRFRGGSLSLIANFSTSICVYTASKIPPAPKSATVALQPSARPRKREPTQREVDYVSYLYHQIDKDYTVDDEEFQARAQASLNVKNKFSLLQDVRDETFYDIIAQVARDPYDAGDKVTLYVSDYTENKLFFHYTYDGLRELAGGEAPGHSQSGLTQWSGPYGKRVMQITVYEPHASFVRSTVRATQWLLLNNLQVKFGHNAVNLEGFLREDRDSMGGKLNVSILETQGDPDQIDPRLKEAVRRLREYKRRYKDELMKLEQLTSAKRKGDEGLDSDDTDKRKKSNSKAKRARRRQEIQKRIEEEQSKNAVDLNRQVTCESQDNDVSSISQILEPSYYDTTINGQCVKLPLPFTCGKYLAHVRVIDFLPHALEDFTASRKASQFDMLSDTGDDFSDDEEDDGVGGSSQHIWEWRFSVQLEDARPQKEAGMTHPRRFWVVVDNAEGQCLTGLDAVDLRADQHALERLREKMFTLWGDLEEHKARDVARQERERSRRPGERPALDSDGEEEVSEEGRRAVSNTPFACCIREFGVRVPEEDPGKADAGEGMRWQRVFGLFGTKIS
ncbi:hypothetical protein GQ53DRAFT_746904 [Thozetella sp. PMI_491]|nr:hypothetical protein GQ53DRAFT_746904 [Thozetella sp. PMI_491]